GEEWSRKGSFIRKPAQGWLHPDERVMGPGVSYIVRYMGCIEVLRSMRSLDFNTRTQVTREAINRLYEAVPGVKGIWKKKVSFIPSWAPSWCEPGLRGWGCLPGSRGGLGSLGAPLFASFTPGNLAFELRFKQYLHSPPKVVAPPDRALGAEESAWGEDEEAAEHDYYNSIPGKEPPPGGLIDSRLRHGAVLGHVHAQPSGSGPPSQVSPPGLLPALPWGSWACPPDTISVSSPQGGFAARRDQSSQPGPPWDLESQAVTPRPLAGQPCDGYLQADGHPLGPRDYEEHMYVGLAVTVGPAATAWLDPVPAAPQPCFMTPPHPLAPAGPFEDALKLHECIAGGSTSPPMEDQWPSPPTRKAPVAPTEEQLRREPWYHGKMSRRDAEKLLQTDGDFLVRDSLTNPGQYVLTGMHSGQPKHLLLVDPEGVVRTKDVLFESISHLISHHRQNEQPIVAAESELHLRQVVRRKQ
ncbi:SHC2 protein, partial [Uria aalge]|nr:SHC2 protein [Uria aalge]